MINKDKWIGTIARVNTKPDLEINQINQDRWVNTISKKNTFNSFKKYSLIGIVFVCGLLFVSVVKNETRNIQKEINNLKAYINVLEFNLSQAMLDNEVITSPENISRLAKENLNTSLVFYKRSQIKPLNDKIAGLTEVSTINKKTTEKNDDKSFSKNLKNQVVKRIEKKRTEIRKLQALYSNPKTIPTEIKTQVTKKIQEKKNGFENIAKSPKDLFTLERVQRWGVVQVVKLFLGMPIIPGK